MFIQITVPIILVLLAIPSGYLLAYLTRDELVEGRKWFRILIIAGFLLFIGAYLYGNLAVSLTGLFISIATLVSYIKSKDKRFVIKKRI